MSDWKDHVRLATTASISPFPPTALITVDGQASAAGDRILVKDQTSAAQNGVWIAQTGTWTRAGDPNPATEIANEMTVRVSEGSRNAHTEWTLNAQGAIAVGTTALEFRDANLLSAEVALGASDSVLSVAKGRRYVIPDGALSASHILTISAAGAVKGDRMIVRSEERGRHNVRLYSNDACVATMMGISVAELYFNGTSWVSLTPGGHGWFNVRDFGARGADDGTVNGSAAERAAIQAAFDAADEACVAGDQRGATVYFPRGIYVIDRPIIVPRRGAFGHIRILGEGQDAVHLARSRASTPKVVKSSTNEAWYDALFGVFVGGTLQFIATGAHEGRILRASGSFNDANEGWAAGDQVIVRGTVLNDTSRKLLPNTSRDPLKIIAIVSDTEIRVSGDVVDETADYEGATLQKNAAVLAPDPNPSNAAQGSWTIEHITLVTDGSSALWYDFGEITDLVNSTYRPSIAVRDVTVVTSSTGAVIPAMFLQYGQRCLFDRVRGIGSGYACVIEYRAGSFGLFRDVGIEALPGPCVYLTQGTLGGVTFGGGSHLLVNCRSDTAVKKPELWLHDQVNVTIIGYTTEGKQTSANCSAKDCRQLTILGGSLGGGSKAWSETLPPTLLSFHANSGAGTSTITRSKGDFLEDGFTVGQTCTAEGVSAPNQGPFTITAVTATVITVAEALADETPSSARMRGNRFADCLVLDNCHNVVLENTVMGPANEITSSDGSARAIRVLGASTNIHLRPAIATSDVRPSVAIDPLAKSCSVLASSGDTTGTQPLGPTEADKLKIWHDIVYVGYKSTGFSGTPNGPYTGVIAKRAGHTQTALVFDESKDGWTTAFMDDETTLNERSAFYASSYRGNTAGALRLQAGQSENIYFAQSTTSDDSAATTFATWGCYIPGTTVSLTFPAGYSFKPNSTSFWESTFSSYLLKFSGTNSWEGVFFQKTDNTVRLAVLPDGVAIGNGTSFGGGAGVVSWQEASATPTLAASAGYQLLWVDNADGKLKARDPNGVRTTIAPKALGTVAGVVLDRSVAAKLTTTDATQTALAAYNISSTATVAVIEVDVTGYVIAGGGTGNTFAARRRIVAKNISGSASVLAVDTIGTDVNEETLGGVAVEASSADVRIKVTGKASVTVVWNAELRVLAASA